MRGKLVFGMVIALAFSQAAEARSWRQEDEGKLKNVRVLQTLDSSLVGTWILHASSTDEGRTSTRVKAEPILQADATSLKWFDGRSLRFTSIVYAEPVGSPPTFMLKMENGNVFTCAQEYGSVLIKVTLFKPDEAGNLQEHLRMMITVRPG